MEKIKQHFRYHKKIDQKVLSAVEKVLKVKALKAIKLKHGEVNHVYKIVIERGNVLARIFQYPTWPEPGKLQWIEKQLTKHKVPHAKILYYSRGGEFFSFGFMVTEFLEGLNGQQAVKNRKISFGDAFYETGKILKKVHRIKIKQFGYLPPEKYGQLDFLKHRLATLKSKLSFLEYHKVMKPGFYDVIKQKVNPAILPFNKYLKPVLIHNDANRENAILTTKGIWTLVDWDNARTGIWLEDYADLTYWVDWDRKPPQAKRVRSIINKNFFKAYGLGGFTQEQIAKIEHAIHIMKTISMMIYFYNFKKSPQELEKTKQKLFRLLK